MAVVAPWTTDDEDAAWDRFFASDYFTKIVEQAKADIAAGRTMPMPCDVRRDTKRRK